jgi:uncharacterized flavoprotein (TIGR03862 family)
MDKPAVVVVGGGPAGLRAAEVLAAHGCRVDLFDQKASVGRKFLVAGKGGLNLTHSEPLEGFLNRYETELPRWREMLADFSPADLRAWAEGLGVETYVGTSGRVFPRGQQAAALLRRWVMRLRELGVTFHVNRRFEGVQPLELEGGLTLNFRDTHTNEESQAVARAAVIALGGASWPKTGSDGLWPTILQGNGIGVAPWQAANCGFEVAWDARLLKAAEGMPLKNVALSAGGKTVAGEALITRYGLEGGTIYQLGRRLRAMPEPRLIIDFKPSLSVEQLLAKVAHGKVTFADAIRRWKLGPAIGALLEFHGPGAKAALPQLAEAVKAFPLNVRGPRPVEEAISSAGGILWEELTPDLMLHRLPGVFAAGEMIDWEAPTGGYLLQGCFASGTRAARGALRFLGVNMDADKKPTPAPEAAARVQPA